MLNSKPLLVQISCDCDDSAKYDVTLRGLVISLQVSVNSTIEVRGVMMLPGQHSISLFKYSQIDLSFPNYLLPSPWYLANMSQPSRKIGDTEVSAQGQVLKRREHPCISTDFNIRLGCMGMSWAYSSFGGKFNDDEAMDVLTRAADLVSSLSLYDKPCWFYHRV